MNSRERVRNIISGEKADRSGLWLGEPHLETWPILHSYFGTSNAECMRKQLGDDFRWICPQFLDCYKHPEGRPIWDLPVKKRHGQPGPFAETEDVDEVHDFPWPNPDYLNFEVCIEALKKQQDYYCASGMWSCFYHDLMDFFGLEAYLIKMYTSPEVVHAVTDHICQFYFEANKRFFEASGNLVDAFFFGNDFGTQLDLICGPDQFDEFIMPWFRRFTDQGHHHNLQVILHSCGAIHKVIDRLIEAGVDCLHPIQAKAVDMDAETLARDFGGRIAFMGGIDTQDLLVNATPEQVRQDVRRVMAALAPRLIVSPSHEALLPNVAPSMKPGRSSLKFV